MMWAATVRRCPTGHARHPSQFGARMQLARALNHAPYLICDNVYSTCSPHLNTEAHYGITCSEPQAALQDPDIICDHTFDCDSSFRSSYSKYSRRRGTFNPHHSSQQSSPQTSYRMDAPNSITETPYLSFPRTISATTQTNRSQEMRVELSYSRREFDTPEDYPEGGPNVRRYEDFRQREEPDDDGVVGLSYQQRSMGGGGPYGGEVWGTEPSIDCLGDRPYLLKRGRTREIVRTCFLVGLSFTFITFVIMGFGVYNMLITTLFLFFLLSTVSLLIFLLMRKPSCFNCCREPFDLTNPTENDPEVQQGLSTYLTESQGVVLKKRLSDSPPPYESPPDYHSLPPEVLVSARGLTGLESSPDFARVHGNASVGRGSPREPHIRSKMRCFAARSSSALLASAAPLLSSSSKNSRVSPPPSPPICSSSRILGLSSHRVVLESQSLNNTSHPPPPYECVIIQTDKEEPKSC